MNSIPQEAVGNFVVKGAVKRELPPVRNSKTFKFKIADTKGYMTVGEFKDGKPGEVFIVVAKQGSTLAGIMDALAISVSHGLQHGVPLKSYVKAFINMSFAPSGLTDDPEIRTATSFVDYIFRKIAKAYLSYEDLVDLGVVSFSDQIAKKPRCRPLYSTIISKFATISKNNRMLPKQPVEKTWVSVFRISLRQIP